MVSEDSDLSMILTQGLQKAKASMGERGFINALNILNNIDSSLDALARINKKLLRVHAAKQDSDSDNGGERAAKSARKASAAPRRRA